MNSRLALVVFVVFLALTLPLRADNEIGYIEKFALAADREQVLGELIPGSEEYYFFHALHYQNTAQKDKLKAIMDQWSARYPQSSQRRIIENRQALLSYDADPKALIAFLKDRLHLQFNHQQEARDQKPNLPTTLDPARISREVFQAQALSQSPDNLSQFKDAALEELVRSKAKLTQPQRRALLARIEHPDIPNLVDLIATDLASKESRGFGEFPIHNLLLPEQLDELAKRIPALFEHEAFVIARLRKLLPSADTDVQFDPAEHEAWLDRLWAYAKNLSPSFNTLKAHILFQRLQFDRGRNIYDKARFLEYLKLPRNAAYINPAYLRRLEAGTAQVDFNADFSSILKAQPIQSDEWLVRDYLLNILKDEQSWEPYTTWLRDTYVKPIFAESKIINGVGDPERWSSLLSPSAFQALKDRVDLDFSPANPQTFAPKDDVSLSVAVKNASKLIVRIYEINTLTFFLTQNRQLNTDLNLDGLVSNAERTHSFDDAAGRGPFRRVMRNFDFPELKGKRGAWIVEFIGGGKSSRALIRKGQWELLQEAGPAGDMLTVVDEAHAPVKDAVVWFEGRRYTPDKTSGRIVVPFSNQPGQKPVILASSSGDFASFTNFEHHAEQYRLDAQFHIEREQLLAGRQATLAIRAALLVADVQLAPDLITDQKLTITSKTLDGISTSREITAAQGLKFNVEKVATHTFTVPDRTEEITAMLTGKVENLSAGGEKKDLSASRTWHLNGIDKTEATFDGHLLKAAGGYAFELLGKNGEPASDQQVVFAFHRYDFDEAVTVPLRSDERGRVSLGALSGVSSLTASLSNNQTRDWPLDQDAALRPTEIHGKPGDVFQVPWFGGAGPLRREDASLFERRDDTLVSDRFAALSVANGFLQLSGLTAGDYRLLLRDGAERASITIKVTAGVLVGDWLLSDSRYLQVPDPAPAQIDNIQTADDALTIQVRNANPSTRVQVVADRYLPSAPWRISTGLSGFERFSPAAGEPARRPNLFVSGRAIGDEYRYILDRRYSKTYPGNMLTRPGLLLNPWEVRSTDLSIQTAQQAEALRRAAGDREGKPAAAAPAPPTPQVLNPEPGMAGTDLDFLSVSAPVLFNLVPDQNGMVRVDRQALGDRHFVQIYAEDAHTAAWRSVALPEAQTKLRDLRLKRNLDPQKAFAESKQVTVLAPGQAITLADVLSADMETYDSLAGIYTLFSTLSKDANLAKFAFILDWPKLKDDEKRAKYSEFACHELNFFLSRKDAAFFQQAVQPYLRNKKDKTFMDDYLLGNDLRRYLEPWAYARLNVAECSLLAQRIPGEAAATARHLRERWEMIPPHRATDEMLFETALRGHALRGDGGDALNEARREVESKLALGVAAPVPGAMAGYGGALGKKPMDRGAAAGLEADAATVSGSVSQLKAAVAGRPMAPEQRMLRYKRSGDASDKDTDAFASTENWRMLTDGEAAKQLRGLARQFYRRIGPTKEWAENNYYQLPIGKQDENLVPINAFWKDFAAWDGKSPFLSTHLAEASRNFSEMMLALAVLDLPFDAPKHQTRNENGQFTLTSGGLLLAFHKQIIAAAPAGEQAELLVSESFFRQNDRYRMEGNEQFDKTVSEEFLAGVVYGANVVVTNPTSTPRNIQLLVQIPQGALPVLGSKATDSKDLRLEAYSTQRLEYYFYFPEPGAESFAHYQAHVSQEEKAQGGAKPLSFKVVRQLSKVDTTSWEYVSQYGSEQEVFAYLDKNNIERIDLTRVAWRARQNVDFFRKLVALLEKRHDYNDVLYSYAVFHNESAPLREWLRHQDGFLKECGPYLDSSIIRIDPIERRAYEHLEYSPLINQRAHRLGAENRVANSVLRGQYQELLNILAHKPKLDAIDQMSVVYYLFLQDRTEEALARFKTIAAESLPTRVQHDYFRCYAAFYEEQLAEARGLASQYAAYPVDRWRKLFADVLSQADEIEGKGAGATTPSGSKPDREAQQGALATTEPSFEFKIEERHIALTWKNLQDVTINYYLMDPEFLFSSSPFVTQDPGRFSIIKPSKTAQLALPADRDALDVPLPAEFERANVLVEILGAGQRKAEAHHANTLKLNLVENYGRLDLHDSIAGKPVTKAYVKVYARLKNGQIRFYKDGYTDLRGKFDYASLNTGSDSSEPPHPVPQSGPANGFDYQMLRPAELGEVDRLAILVLSDTYGTLVREANPPAE